MAVVHELDAVRRWAPGRPHRVKWRAVCSCWWPSPWCDDVHDAIAAHDEHQAAHADTAGQAV